MNTLYYQCTIEWQDDETRQDDLIFKTTHDVVECEDDLIFYYGIVPEPNMIVDNFKIISTEPIK